MHYEVIIGEAALTVTTASSETEGRLTLTVGDTEIQGALGSAEDHRVIFGSGGAPREAWVARGDDGLWTWCAGRVRLAQDASVRRARRRGGAAGAARDVTPPMPAVVTNLLCAVGDEVKKGQGLVVVAAMKMEMTLTAPFPGTVAAVHTQVGAKVNPGEILVDLTPAPADADAPTTTDAAPTPEGRHG